MITLMLWDSASTFTSNQLHFDRVLQRILSVTQHSSSISAPQFCLSWSTYKINGLIMNTKLRRERQNQTLLAATDQSLKQWKITKNHLQQTNGKILYRCSYMNPSCTFWYRKLAYPMQAPFSRVLEGSA